MKWFLLFFTLIFYSPAFSQRLDLCLDKMINFRLMNKMKLIIRATDPVKAEKKSKLAKAFIPVSLNEMIPVDQICSHLSLDHTKRYLEMIHATGKLRSLLIKEYATTKKISSRFYQAIASEAGSESPSLTLEDVCQDSENLLSQMGECEADRLMLPRISGIQFSQLSAVIACQRLLPIIRQAHKRSLQCKHNNRRDLPGTGPLVLPDRKMKR